MKLTLRGYITSRKFLDERAPQSVQNLVIREFCKKINSKYLLSATEYYMENNYSILKKIIDNDLNKNVDGIVGYSIFQSIDYGKIPILHKDWSRDMKYPFRASTQKQFETQVAEISNLSVEDRNNYLGGLREHLSKYSDVEKWRDDLLSIYNKDGDQVWLPTSISPSKDV